MKKYEYKLASYSFNTGKLQSSDVLKVFNKEGTNGWELVQWEVYTEWLNVFHTRSITYITATWKRELHK